MKISVIIPVYNKAGYINDLLSDLLHQTFREYECILVNDGSTDNSGELCDSISKADNRFRTFHLEHGGVSNARNHALGQTTGEYITFIDADDRLYPEYLENLFHCITENQVDFVISGLEKYWETSDKTEQIQSPCLGKWKKEEILPRFAQIQKNTGIFGYCAAKIFRAELVREVRFDPAFSLAEDFDFYLKVYRKVNTIYFDDKCYYRYLQGAKNSSADIDDYEIDYFAQLTINLNYKNFLSSQRVYKETNQLIVENLMNNYMFFSIFYCPIEKLENRCVELKGITEKENIKLRGGTTWQKWILWLLKTGNFNSIKVTLQLYRGLRKFIKGHIAGRR